MNLAELRSQRVPFRTLVAMQIRRDRTRLRSHAGEQARELRNCGAVTQDEMIENLVR